MAVPTGVVTIIGPVVSPGGTRTMIVEEGSLADRISDGVIVEKATVLTGSKPVPTTVTIASAGPAGGLKYIMRGPPGVAIWLPENAPCAPEPDCIQNPPALLS